MSEGDVKMGANRWALCAVASVAAALVVAACGPRNLSALGNPGDFCTERSACTDGSDCRQTEDGFRCVGGQAEKAPGPRADGDVSVTDEEPNGGHFAVEAGNEPVDGGVEPMREEPSDEASVEEPPAEEDGGVEYLPPSRRRRGRR